jgi:transposase
MARAYSADMRQRVIGRVESGASRREAAEHYEVSPSSAVIWVARRSGGSSSGTRSRSKKILRAAEHERADVARARRRWMREQGLFDPAKLVFIDETSANTKMVSALRPLRTRRAASGS